MTVAPARILSPLPLLLSLRCYACERYRFTTHDLRACQHRRTRENFDRHLKRDESRVCRRLSFRIGGKGEWKRVISIRLRRINVHAKPALEFLNIAARNFRQGTHFEKR